MRIDKIEVCRLDLPFKEKMRVSFGVIPMARDILVRIYSDEGPAGISTATPVPYYLGQTQDTLLAAARFLAPLILGRDPFDIEAANHLMDRALGGNQPAKAAFDMALYDLIGKAAGRPIHDFLGGKVQEDFPSAYGLALKEPDEMAQDVLNCMQAGFRSFEVHVGTGIAADVARVRAIREAAGNEITVIVDVNGHWTVKEAIHAIRALQEFDVMVEQPVKGLEAMAEVRAAVEAPIVADESCHTVEDTVEIIRRKAADVLCVKPIKAGGLTKARRICNLADAFGLKVRIDGLPGETLVSNTASAHLTVTLRNTVADGVMQHWRLAEDVVESGGLIFEDAKVRVTDDPGLGLSERSGVAQVVETFTAD